MPTAELSVRAAFPRFVQMEREHRSLIKALRRVKPGGTSPFLAIRGGMSLLVDRLKEKLSDVRLRTGVGIEAIEKGPPLRVRIGGEWAETDHLLLAIPSSAAATLVKPIHASAGERMAAIKLIGSATVSLGFRDGDIPMKLDASGLVIPKRDRKEIVACTWSSVKFEGRAPAGHALLRCFFKDPPPGGDEELIGGARRDLERIMGIRAEPVISKVSRWPDANPIYRVGHLKAVESIEKRLPDGIHVAGASYGGVGLPDGVRDGRRIAEKIATST